MRKKSVSLVVVIILQMGSVLLFEHYVFRPSIDARFNRLSERLTAEGLPANQADTLTNALSAAGGDVSSHVSSVALMLIILNSILFSAIWKDKE